MQLQEARRRLVPLPDEFLAAPAALEPRVVLGAGTTAGVPRPVSGTRRGAVLIVLYPDADGEAVIPLMERPLGDLRHPGEISLPGGAWEERDESDVETALREAHEEIGLRPDDCGLDVIGELPTVDVRVSGFRLVPVVAFAQREPTFDPDPREVASLVRAPLDAFLPGAPVERVEEDRGGIRLRYGAFPIGRFRVWGATAFILGRLGATIGAATRAPR